MARIRPEGLAPVTYVILPYLVESIELQNDDYL